MSGPLIYVDNSEVREGALNELKAAIDDLVRLIEEREPQLLAYSVYLTADERRMTVVHVHADPASLDRHTDVVGPELGRFTDLIDLKSIHVYGKPSERARAQLREKARVLGSGGVVVHESLTGFSRFEATAKLG